MTTKCFENKRFNILWENLTHYLWLLISKVSHTSKIEYVFKI